jgi:REP element-mobilizing transposase RayT
MKDVRPLFEIKGKIYILALLFLWEMSSKYKFGDERHIHFVTFTVVHWIDFFIREEYRSVLIESIKFCQREKGLHLYGYCIMTSHIHLLISCDGVNSLESIVRDMKSFTSQCFRKLLVSDGNNYESRKSWMLWMMNRSGDKRKGDIQYRFWQAGNHTVEIWTDEVFHQKLNYIHENPVVSGFVTKAEDWLYSSARNYASLSSVLEIIYDR